MSIHKALGIGLAGNELSKKITGSSEVSMGRTVVATGSGALLGGIATSAVVVAGVAASPVVVPLAVASGIVAGIASLFD